MKALSSLRLTLQMGPHLREKLIPWGHIGWDLLPDRFCREWKDARMKPTGGSPTESKETVSPHMRGCMCACACPGV